MDRLEAMLVFVTAVETGSLSAAGRRLSMPLATVSRKISDLEAHLKTRILIRSTRKLTLTDAGRLYEVLRSGGFVLVTEPGARVPGEIHAVMGPNGSGKSTLSKAIGGHPDYTITSGEVLLDGENILGLAPDDRALISETFAI